MGVTSSKLKKVQAVDFGSVVPLGLYGENEDYDLNRIRDLIASKRIAPFYKGLSNPLEEFKIEKIPKKRYSKSIHDYYYKDSERKLYEKLYSNAIECPICFLYYPANINFARCCDQPICTECFVQIKNPSEKSTISCPFCMTEHFGVIYQPPTGIGSKKSYHVSRVRSTTSGIHDCSTPKRKSVDVNDSKVVLIDHVRLNNRINSRGKNMMLRSSSIHFWMPSRRNSSIQRYISALPLDDLTLEDMIMINSIRHSLIDGEDTYITRRNNRNSTGSSIIP
ncbi:hypothetical protein K501DRAFT_314311 [Backusella circina FSU 941]|nr:hypothetical protein K501DRAFT_314311 [Backusella circina FSU 941]